MTVEMMRFPCPNCGVRLKASATDAGKEQSCPKCRRTFTVPPRSEYQTEPILSLSEDEMAGIGRKEIPCPRRANAQQETGRQPETGQNETSSGRGSIEMVLPGAGRSGTDLWVVYKCPHCCAGSKQVKWEVVGGSRDEFVNAACANEDIRTECLNCHRRIILEVDAGLANMMRAFRAAR